MKREIIFALGGAVAGFASATALFYFVVYRKYIPMHELEREVGELQSKRKDLCNQIEEINKAFQDHKRSTDDATLRMDKELDFYDQEIKNAKNELKQLQKHISTAKSFIDYSHPDPSYPVEIPQVKDVSCDPNEYVAENDEPDEIDEDPVDISDEPTAKELAMAKALNGKFEIHEGNPRWDGPLTEDEQQQFDEANGDIDLEESILRTIKERRYNESIDEENPKYQIDRDTFDDQPFFFDTENLDYYEGDDVLCRGFEIVQDIAALIDPDVLSKFGKRSRSGNPNIVYCRNDYYGTDYEITRHHGSYRKKFWVFPKPSDSNLLDSTKA